MPEPFDRPPPAFEMTLEEAVARSFANAAYARASEVPGGYVYCDQSGALHTGAKLWDGDPASLKWRPIGGEKSWLPEEKEDKTTPPV